MDATSEREREAYLLGRVGKRSAFADRFMSKNPIETKGIVIKKRYVTIIEQAYENTMEQARTEFTRVWAEIIGLYNVMQANRPSVRTNAAQAELHRVAVGKLSLKLATYGIGPLARIIALGDSDPARVLDALAPRSMLLPPPDKHFGPMVTVDNEEQLRDLMARSRTQAEMMAEHNALAAKLYLHRVPTLNDE